MTAAFTPSIIQIITLVVLLSLLCVVAFSLRRRSRVTLNKKIADTVLTDITSGGEELRDDLKPIREAAAERKRDLAAIQRELDALSGRKKR